MTVGSDEGGGVGVAGMTGGAPEVIREIGCIGSGICSEGCAAFLFILFFMKNVDMIF